MDKKFNLKNLKKIYSKNKQDIEIAELNTLLKGEHMAIDSYEKFIEKVQDQNIKNEFQKIQQNHGQHATRLTEQIQNLGGRPSKGVGINSKIAQSFTQVKDLKKHSDLFYVKDAYNGENMGIKSASEMIKGDLAGESLQIVENVLNEDKNHLNKLHDLIDSGSIRQ